MKTEMNDSNTPAVSTGEGSGPKFGVGPKADSARTPKELPRVSSEKIVRHGHVR